MDATSVNRKVRQYLKFANINDQVELGLPEFHDNHWFVTLEAESRGIGTVVLSSTGEVIPEYSTSLQEIVDEL